MTGHLSDQSDGNKVYNVSMIYGCCTRIGLSPSICTAWNATWPDEGHRSRKPKALQVSLKSTRREAYWCTCDTWPYPRPLTRTLSTHVHHVVPFIFALSFVCITWQMAAHPKTQSFSSSFLAPPTTQGSFADLSIADVISRGPSRERALMIGGGHQNQRHNRRTKAQRGTPGRRCEPVAGHRSSPGGGGGHPDLSPSPDARG